MLPVGRAECQMTPDELSAKIDAELAGSCALNNWHGITAENVEQFLIPPKSTDMLDSFSNERRQFWIVADERPESNADGYLVVFDEINRSFGLAVKGGADGAATFIGCYGGFVETLNAM